MGARLLLGGLNGWGITYFHLAQGLRMGGAIPLSLCLYGMDRDKFTYL